MKEANKKFGNDVGKNILKRITELEAFDNLKEVPSELPFRREKLINRKDEWSIRVYKQFRMEIRAIDVNENLELIKNIEIERVSKHYE